MCFLWQYSIQTKTTRREVLGTVKSFSLSRHRDWNRMTENSHAVTQRAYLAVSCSYGARVVMPQFAFDFNRHDTPHCLGFFRMHFARQMSGNQNVWIRGQVV